MTSEEKRKIYVALSAPFPEEAIERTDGRITGRGYSTTGIKAQYVINRLNEVVGLGNWRTTHATRVREITSPKGRPMFDAVSEVTLQLGEFVGGNFVPWAEAVATGGHSSVSEADAIKGAGSNSTKKAAAILGCGKQAYEGTLDDDNVPAEETTVHSPQQQRTVERPVQSPPVQQVQRPAGPPAQAEEPKHEPPPAQTQPASGPSRNRLTSKQLAAIWALARKLNYAQQDFRREVKSRHGVQVEFLDKTAASTLIGQLSARASNGASHPSGEHGAEA